MSSSRYRPRRRLRSEIFPLAVILALPVALFLASPAGVPDFKPVAPPVLDSTYNAFVSLDADREAQLLASARTSWQSDSASRRGVRADLLGCGDASEGVRLASGLPPPAGKTTETVSDYECDFLPAGVAAEAPAPLTAEPPAAPTPAFAKEDLLKLN